MKSWKRLKNEVSALMLTDQGKEDAIEQAEYEKTKKSWQILLKIEFVSERLIAREWKWQSDIKDVIKIWIQISGNQFDEENEKESELARRLTFFLERVKGIFNWPSS